MAISVDNTYLTNYSTDASASAADKLSSQIQNASTDDETMEACKQFESYMIEILTEDEDDDSTSSQYVDMFHDNYIQTIAESMTNSGQSIGLADQLYNAIKKNEGTQV